MSFSGRTLREFGDRGFILGATAIHLSRREYEVVPSCRAGFGDSALSICGLIDGLVYSLEFVEGLPPSPRTLSVTRMPMTLGGQTMPVGWNWINSMSSNSAPA